MGVCVSQKVVCLGIGALFLRWRESNDKVIAPSTISGCYIRWKGLRFQVGALFNAVPSHGTFTLNNGLIQKDPEQSRKNPPEGLLHSSNDAFLLSIMSYKSKYVGDIHHPWLSILLKLKVPTDASVWKKGKYPHMLLNCWERFVIIRSMKKGHS